MIPTLLGDVDGKDGYICDGYPITLADGTVLK